MKRSAFKNRLFLMFGVITSIIIVAFIFVLIAFTAPLNKQIELEHQISVFDNSLLEAEGVLEQMGMLAQQVSSNSEILSTFISLSGDGDTGNYFSANLTDAIRIGSILQDISGVQSCATRIVVFNQDGDYIQFSNSYEIDSLTQDMIQQAEKSKNLYDDLTAEDNYQIFVSRHTDFFTGNESMQMISIKRALKISENSKIFGVVEIDINLNQMDSFSFWSSGYTLFDDSGEVIYPLTAETPDSSLTSQIQSAAANDEKSFETEYNGKTVTVIVSRVESSGWILARTFQSRELTLPYLRNYVLFVAGGLILLVLLLVVIYYIIDRLTSPLKTLADSVRNVSYQNMQMAVDKPEISYSSEELAALNTAFHTMLARLDKSFSAEMHAYMRALQSEMDPHFLYNMLSVIIASSESSGDKRTVAMCLKLTAMLRYIADYDHDFVTMDAELKHAENYLDLMKERYEDMLTFEFEIDDILRNIQVPKLIVQPLTENCFKHGFKVRPPWFVTVRLWSEDGYWKLRVQDNGIGISDNMISHVKEQLERYSRDLATGYTELKIGGMGLVNTLLRLTFFYKEPFFYNLSSLPEGGTAIEIGGPLDDPGFIG